MASPIVLEGRLSAVDGVASGDVWAVGVVGATTSSPTPLIEHWDGSTWTVVPTPDIPSGNLADVVALSSNDVWAVGGVGDDPLIIHWDGVHWSASLLPNPPGIVFLGSISAVSPTDIWAAGSFNQDPFGSQTRNVTMHWDGGDWSFVSTPTIGTGHNSLADIVAVSASDAWIIGNYTPSQGGEQRLFSARWNGSGWNLIAMPQPPRSSFVTSAVALGGDIRAVGFLDLSGRFRAAEVKWHDSAWSLGLMANSQGVSTQPLDVAPDLAGGLWAVGLKNPDSSGPRSPLVEHYCP